MPSKPFDATLRLPTMNLKDAVIIDLHGEINGVVESALNAAYEQAEQRNPSTIILNFTDVDYMNSTGIALIVGLLAKARKAHCTLTVYGLSEHYLELFNITRLVDFMNVVKDEQSAVSSILTPKGN
ncbi:MAG: STAS domain-containing protein [Anaerolineae bacterium]|nr:STAS domain-containing protein [Anaerolineae bacterium]